MALSTIPEPIGTCRRATPRSACEAGGVRVVFGVDLLAASSPGEGAQAGDDLQGAVRLEQQPAELAKTS